MNSGVPVWGPDSILFDVTGRSSKSVIIDPFSHQSLYDEIFPNVLSSELLEIGKAEKLLNLTRIQNFLSGIKVTIGRLRVFYCITNKSHHICLSVQSTFAYPCLHMCSGREFGSGQSHFSLEPFYFLKEVLKLTFIGQKR